jgi:hypothetical protein
MPMRAVGGIQSPTSTADARKNVRVKPAKRMGVVARRPRFEKVVLALHLINKMVAVKSQSNILFLFDSLQP